MSFIGDMAIPVPVQFDGYNINVITKFANQSVPQPKDRQSLYKTELCREWTQSGWCYYGKRCSFSHGLQELKPVFRSKKWRTKHCRNWHLQGFCPYEHRCQFLHDQSSYRAGDDNDSELNMHMNNPEYNDNVMTVVRDVLSEDTDQEQYLDKAIRNPTNMNMVPSPSLLYMPYKVEDSIPSKKQKAEREIHMSSDKEDTENSGSSRKLRNHDSYENSSTSQSIYNEKSVETIRQDSIVGDATKLEYLPIVEEKTLDKNPIFASLPSKPPVCTLNRLKIDPHASAAIMPQHEKKQSLSNLNGGVKSMVAFSIVTDGNVSIDNSGMMNTNKNSPNAKRNSDYSQKKENETSLSASKNVNDPDSQHQTVVINDNEVNQSKDKDTKDDDYSQKKTKKHYKSEPQISMIKSISSPEISSNDANVDNMDTQIEKSISDQKSDSENLNPSLEMSLNSSMELSVGTQNGGSINDEPSTPSAQLSFAMPDLNFLPGNWDMSGLNTQTGLDFNAMASNYLSSLTPAQLEFVSGQLLEVAQNPQFISKNLNGPSEIGLTTTGNEPNSNGNEKLDVRNLFSSSNLGLGTTSATPIGVPGFGDLEFPLPTPSPPPSMLNPTPTPGNGGAIVKQNIPQVITPAPLIEQDIPTNPLTPTTMNLFNSINAVLNSQSSIHNSTPLITQTQSPALLTSTEAAISTSNNRPQPLAIPSTSVNNYFGIQSPTPDTAITSSIGLTIAPGTNLMTNKLWFNNFNSNHNTPNSLENLLNTDYSALVEYLTSADTTRVLPTINVNTGDTTATNENDPLVSLPPSLSQTSDLPSITDTLINPVKVSHNTNTMTGDNSNTTTTSTTTETNTANSNQESSHHNS